MNPLEPLDVAMLTAELLSSPLHVGPCSSCRHRLTRGQTTSTSCIERRSPATNRSTYGFADIRTAAWTPAGYGFGANPKLLT